MTENQSNRKKRCFKKPRVSLAVKLNLLMVAIIFTVAAVLIIISYNAYTQTIYEPVFNSLKNWVADCAETLEDSEEDLGGYVINNPQALDLLLKSAKSEELQSIRDAAADNADLKDKINDWMMAISDYNEESTLDTDTVYGSFMLTLYNLYDQMQIQSDRHEHTLYKVLIEGVSGNKGYTLAYIGDDETSLNNARFGSTPELPSVFSDYSYDSSIPPTQINTEYGDLLFAAEPVRNQNGDVIARVWAVMDVDDILTARRHFLLIMILLTLGLALMACVVTVLLLRRIVLRPVRDLSRSASNFAAGDRDYTKADVIQLGIKSNDEIGDLYHEIQSMQTRIIDYTEERAHTAAEKERILTELELAARIQNSMLPMTFPPFPDRHEFDIYASMDPAREVGGDFYDFFFIDEDHLCLLIADVSGKGIPAALYMMISKVILQSCAMLNLPPDQIIRKANEALSSNNPEHMFVTVWLGVLEVSTGILTAVNAGHEYPAVMQAGQSFEILKDKHGMLVGAIGSFPYKSYQIQMKPGDKIFVYTDGVPEATDNDNNMFGMERMADTLKGLSNETPENVLRGVRASVDRFINGAPQFDDLTMLCLEYKGS